MVRHDRVESVSRRRARATPERLVDAAERLFAESDFEGVSLRQVAAAAGVNSAAVHYHFGSREALLRAVLLRRMEGIQKRRETLLAEFKARDEPPTVRSVVEIIVLPLAEMIAEPGASGRAYIRLLARVYADRKSLVSDMVMSHFGDYYRELGGWLARALPHIPKRVRDRRMSLVVGSSLHTLADSDPFYATELDESELTLLEEVAELIDFGVGGLCGAVEGSAPIDLENR